MLKMLIVGATSALAHETVKFFAAEGAQLFLAGRNPDKLNLISQDLKVRGAAQVETFVIDLNDFGRHQELVDEATSTLGGLDTVLFAHGTLSDQEESVRSIEMTLQELNTNFLSTVSLLTIIANQFEAQRRGVIAVISSVAGDRGRGSNYVYGAAMAGKTAFVSGLRARMHKFGVHVLTVKPGPIDTPMTADLPKNALFGNAPDTGYSIYKAMKSGTDVLYTPWYWRYIMMIIRSIPERVFKRTRL